LKSMQPFAAFDLQFRTVITNLTHLKLIMEKMKHAIMTFFIAHLAIAAFGQEIIIDEGKGVGQLKIGQSFEEVVSILGFSGELKTYDEYVAEELFVENPETQLECVIGFDYYVKYQHLLPLPVSYLYFKDNVVNQIKVSSFPEYYFAMAQASRTSKGLKFWETEENTANLYGTDDLEVNYDSFILNAHFYLNEGITFFFRDGSLRTAHIYPKQTQNQSGRFAGQF
jgi:hypothetical protein